MCGRFTIMVDAEDLQEQLALGSLPANWRPRYNVAPAQPVAVVSDAQTRQVEWMRWGLVPSWAKDLEIGNRLINARSETVTEKPSFRSAFVQRRCFLLADGFYEWQHLEGKKGPAAPFHFHLKDRRAFGLAGLWEAWRSPEGKVVHSCTILTTQANAVVAPIHDRMPVILSGADLWRWILPATPVEHLALLHPYPESELERVAVSRLVNRSDYDGPDCVLPAGL
jgi:putative SOS response-associated peptidase YedK